MSFGNRGSAEATYGNVPACSAGVARNGSILYYCDLSKIDV